MANINEIMVGASYTLAAKGKTPATAVKVVSVKGRWVRVAADFNGAEMNVAAGDLTSIKAVRLPGELAKNGVVDPRARASYARVKVDGIVHVDNGDEVSEKMRGMEINEMAKFAAGYLGVSAQSLLDEYAHLNNGMKAMNIRNRVRRVVREQSKEA